MGAIGGSIFHGIKGFRYAPSVSHFINCEPFPNLILMISSVLVEHSKERSILGWVGMVEVIYAQDQLHKL